MTEWVGQDELICKQSHTFIKLYYDVMDRKRERTPNLYTDDDPTLVWNGNVFHGFDSIAKFMTTLPVTQHELVSMDAQKIPMAATGGEEYIAIHTAGSVTMQESVHAFTETFTLMMEGTTFKVKSQRFRYVD